MEPLARELELVELELAALLHHGNGLIGEVCDHLLSAKGKRLRPALLLLTSDMAGAACREECVRAAAAVELVHTATLIHDDTIDASPLRRGVPTVNSLWNERVSILMGDYIYSKVFDILAGSSMFGAMGILAGSTNDMTVSEMLQMEKRGDLEITECDYMSIIDGKTASLIAAACEIGAMEGGCHDGEAEIFSAFGRQVGLAFQIADDILDLVADGAALGKPRGSDLKQGNVTLPLIAALRNAPEPDRRRMRELASARFRGEGIFTGDEGTQELVHLVEKHGGVKYAREEAARCVRKAKSHLLRFGHSPSREALLSAADFAAGRSC